VAALNTRLPFASRVQVSGSQGSGLVRTEPLKSPMRSCAVGTRAVSGPVPRRSRRHSSDQKKKTLFLTMGPLKLPP
jgi:hypothetical protein